MSEMKIHPVADLFPMMCDEELQDLAADITVSVALGPAHRETQRAGEGTPVMLRQPC
jgi:hypothetical protein